MTEIVSPRSLPQALERLEERPDLRPIAGCTDLMVGESADYLGLSGVLDLLSIPELRGIEERERDVAIGATSTFSEIRQSDLIRARLPALAAAAAAIGGWQIQNRATIGGNIVNASPAGDSLPVLLALDASVVVGSVHGERTIPLSSFYVGYRETRLGAGELLARVLVPFPSAESRQYFRKVGTREAQAISKVVVALCGRVEAGRIEEYRLAAGSVAATPVRLAAVEMSVLGTVAEPRAADRAGRVAAESVEPIDDVRSTAAYRRFVLERVVRRMTLDLLA